MALNKIMYIASDHAGFQLKQSILLSEEGKSLNLMDLGTFNEESADYPDYAQKLAASLSRDKTAFGILICGTGIGISIAANRYKYIRAALCYNEETAKLAREHNNANVIVFGARYTSLALALSCIRNFLNTDFAGGRHQNRVEKLSNIL